MTDYLYAQTLSKMAAQLGQIPAAPVKDSEAKPADDFRKLLDQKKGETVPKTEPKADAKPAERTDAEPQTQETAPAVEDPKELEKQMALAAMAVMQNPVVTEESLQEVPEEMIIPVEEASAEVMSVQLEAPQASAQEAGQPVLTEDAAGETAEGAEQTVEAPQAEVKPAERDTVEIKVTAREDAAQTEDSGEEDTPSDAPVETQVFKDVREIPVENQIGGRLAQALNAGDTHVEIQLNPENLGRVTVEMTFAENGSLHVTLHAESGKTMNLLEKGLDNLHMMLAKNAQQEVHVEVQKQEESQQQNFYDGRGGHAQHQGQRRERREESRSGDFLQQLRLGLVPEEIQ